MLGGLICIEFAINEIGIRYVCFSYCYQLRKLEQLKTLCAIIAFTRALFQVTCCRVYYADNRPSSSLHTDKAQLR